MSVSPRPSGERWLLLGWVAFLVVTVVVLHRIGGILAPPPLTEPGELARWTVERAPDEAAVAVARLMALASAWYLLASTTATAVARVAGAARLVRAAEAVSTPLVRRLVSGAVGVSLATAAAGGGTAVAWAGTDLGGSVPTTVEPGGSLSAEVPGTPPVMRLLAPTEAGAPEPAAAEAGPAAAAPDRSGPARDAEAGGPTIEPGDDGAAGSEPAPRSWTVRPGDHLWAVAEQVLIEAWERAPTDAEVDPYWRAVVERNRSVLRVPGNPDLVFPGQVLAVPPPPARP